jgi:hypothetical protein
MAGICSKKEDSLPSLVFDMKIRQYCTPLKIPFDIPGCGTGSNSNYIRRLDDRTIMIEGFVVGKVKVIAKSESPYPKPQGDNETRFRLLPSPTRYTTTFFSTTLGSLRCDKRPRKNLNKTKVPQSRLEAVRSLISDKCSIHIPRDL